MMQEEIQRAKVINWAKLVEERANKLCEIRQNDTDLFVQLLSGDIFNKAVDQIALEIQAGLYDEMLMPKECNL